MAAKLSRNIKLTGTDSVDPVASDRSSSNVTSRFLRKSSGVRSRNRT